MDGLDIQSLGPRVQESYKSQLLNQIEAVNPALIDEYQELDLSQIREKFGRYCSRRNLEFTFRRQLFSEEILGRLVKTPESELKEGDRIYKLLQKLVQDPEQFRARLAEMFEDKPEYIQNILSETVEDQTYSFKPVAAVKPEAKAEGGLEKKVATIEILEEIDTRTLKDEETGATVTYKVATGVMQPTGVKGIVIFQPTSVQ